MVVVVVVVVVVTVVVVVMVAVQVVVLLLLVVKVIAVVVVMCGGGGKGGGRCFQCLVQQTEREYRLGRLDPGEPNTARWPQQSEQPGLLIEKGGG